MSNLDVVKNEIIRVIKLIREDWSRTEIIFQFPPFINQSYNTLLRFFDVNDVKTRIIPDDDSELDKSLYDFIVDINKSGTYNQITFSTSKNKYDEAKIEVIYNQKIVDDFEADLPKSQRGKTKAWYAPENS